MIKGKDNEKGKYGNRITIESDDAELTALVSAWLGDAGYELVPDGGFRVIDAETRGGSDSGDDGDDDGALYLVCAPGGHKNELMRPFTHSELTSAIRPLIPDEGGELVCDHAARRIVYRGGHAALTNKEYEIMKLLFERGESGVSREEVAAIARRRGGERETNAADVYVCHLRRKLRDLTGESKIKTLRGRGYALIK